jgi:hypothetical protein
MTGPTSVADAFGLGLPDGWMELPLEPEPFAEFVDRQLTSLDEVGLKPPERRRFELLTRQVRSLLLSEGGVFAAAAIALVGEPGDEQDAELVASGVVIATTSRVSLTAPTALTADLLLRGLDGRPGDAEGQIDLDPPQRVRLPAGPAVRLARLHRGKLGPGGRDESIVQSYLVPFDEGERLCTLQFVTPNVDHGGIFSELFDDIARTLRIFREGEPTDFAVPADGMATTASQEAP